MDDGHRKPFQALLVDVYFVIFYFLSAGSRLWPWWTFNLYHFT